MSEDGKLVAAWAKKHVAKMKKIIEKLYGK